MGPCSFIATRHDARPIPRTLFSSRNTCTHVEDTLGFQFFNQLFGIKKTGIAAVDDDVARIEKGDKLLYYLVNRRSCLDHEHCDARFFQ
jgi:hypothetical protein